MNLQDTTFCVEVGMLDVKVDGLEVTCDYKPDHILCLPTHPWIFDLRHVARRYADVIEQVAELLRSLDFGTDPSSGYHIPRPTKISTDWRAK